MNDMRQAELWVEGFVKAADAQGVSQDAIPQLLKLAKQRGIQAAHPAEFEAGAKAAMDKAGAGFWRAIGEGTGVNWLGRQVKSLWDPDVNLKNQIRIDKATRDRARSRQALKDSQRAIQEDTWRDGMSERSHREHAAEKRKADFQNRLTRTQADLEERKQMQDLQAKYQPQGRVSNPYGDDWKSPYRTNSIY